MKLKGRLVVFNEDARIQLLGIYKVYFNLNNGAGTFSIFEYKSPKKRVASNNLLDFPNAFFKLYFKASLYS